MSVVWYKESGWSGEGVTPISRSERRVWLDVLECTRDVPAVVPISTTHPSHPIVIVIIVIVTIPSPSHSSVCGEWCCE